MGEHYSPKGLYKAIEKECPDDIVRYMNCAEEMVRENVDTAFKFTKNEVSELEKELGENRRPVSVNMGARYFKDIANTKLNYFINEGCEEALYEKRLFDFMYGGV